MADQKGVLIYGEVSEGKLAPVTHELLGIGRRLADARGEACAAVLIDRKADACAREAIAYGADRVYVVEDAPTEFFEGASFTAITEKLCKEKAAPAIP